MYIMKKSKPLDLYNFVCLLSNYVHTVYAAWILNHQHSLPCIVQCTYCILFVHLIPDKN